jgi:hypothetical protein
MGEKKEGGNGTKGAKRNEGAFEYTREIILLSLNRMLFWYH